MRILIVDDDELSRELLRHALREAGYKVKSAANGREALDILRRTSCRMVISDWNMPEMDGVQLCREIRAGDFSSYVYTILLTSRDQDSDIVEGLSAGADDFITKPFNPAELCVRVRAGERVLSLETRDLALFAMAKLAESRDWETGAHLERIRNYCRVIAQDLTTQPKFRDVVNAEYIRLIYQTSPLHDIGKVGIPDSVLLKPGRLSDAEFAIMKKHTIIGARTLNAALRKHPRARFLRMARDIALTHHEHYDGTGYPRGKAGEEIPLCGRITAVADVYDALTTKRVYKEALTHQVAHSILVNEAGKHFDPDIVQSFLRTEDRFLAIRARLEEESERAPARRKSRERGALAPRNGSPGG
jgi:putative two-component system response regulator